MKTIKKITYINRFIMFPFISLVLLGALQLVLQDEQNESFWLIAAILAIPLGIFQVISSIKIYSHIEKTNIKLSLITYYIASLICVYTFFIQGLEKKEGEIYTQILMSLTPVLIAIGFTVIIELLYSSIKNSTEDIKNNWKGELKRVNCFENWKLGWINER